MLKISVNACFRAGQNIPMLVNEIDAFDVCWHLSRLKNVIDNLIQEMQDSVDRKDPSLRAILRNPPKEGDDRTEFETARAARDRLLAEEGDRVGEFDLPMLPQKVWEAVPKTHRYLLIPLTPFFDSPAS